MALSPFFSSLQGTTAQHRRRANVIGDSATTYDEANRVSILIGDSMHFGAHAALIAANQTTAPFFFNSRLKAVRYALR